MTAPSAAARIRPLVWLRSCRGCRRPLREYRSGRRRARLREEAVAEQREPDHSEQHERDEPEEQVVREARREQRDLFLASHRDHRPGYRAEVLDPPAEAIADLHAARFSPRR